MGYNVHCKPGISKPPVRNWVTQLEVRGQQASIASSVFTAALNHSLALLARSVVTLNSHSIDSEVMKNGNMGKNLDKLLILKNQCCTENAINCAGKNKSF